MSDCWAILDFHEHHHVTDTVEESVAMAVNNGCDLNCGSAFLHLKDAYDKGLVSDEAITAKSRKADGGAYPSGHDEGLSIAI